MDQIVSDRGDRLLVLRGRLVIGDEPVILKCRASAPPEGDRRLAFRTDLLRYESSVYEHAIGSGALDNPEFFAPLVAIKSRAWSFDALDSVDARNFGTVDRCVLNWMRGLSYDRVEDFNRGVNVLVVRDCGRTSFWGHASEHPDDTDADAFVVQMACALDVMCRAGLVHGDLRWENVAYEKIPEGEDRFFDTRNEMFASSASNEFCVEFSRRIKIFDWDNAHFASMPERHARRYRAKYHASSRTNMNDLYDKIGFLRLLHYHFPSDYLRPADVASMEPAFSEYVYVDARDGAPMHQISQKGRRGDPIWPNVAELRRAVDAALARAYVEAATRLIAQRKERENARFELAVEGDNVEGILESLRYPRVMDLDGISFRNLETVAEERIKHGVNERFYAPLLRMARGKLYDCSRS